MQKLKLKLGHLGLFSEDQLKLSTDNTVGYILSSKTQIQKEMVFMKYFEAINILIKSIYHATKK